MDSIAVSVKELFEMASDLKNDGMDFVEISLQEADEDVPASLEFEAWSKSDPDCGVNYEGIDQIET